VFAVELARWSAVRVGVKLANSLEVARDLVKLREAYLREAKNVAEAETDAAGEYRFAALASGEHRVIASHPSHLASFENFAAVDAAGGAHCDIELAEAASISGRVVGEDGAALAGAVVEAEAVEERAKPGRERADAIAAAWEEGRILLAPARAETQSDGSFRITPLEPGTYALTCRKSGYAPSSMPMVPAGTADAVLTLQRGGAVAGRVLAPDRTPLRGAAVVLRAAPSTEVHRVFNYQEVDLSVLDAKPMETRSAEDGSFRLEGVPEGSYELAVSAVGFARLERDLEISGAREDLGDLVVATASVISGLVVGPGGQPLEGAVVRADAPRGRIRRSNVLSRTEPEALIEARSGPDGRFELGGLALGRYDVTAALEGLARATATAVETGEQDLRLALSSGISVCGRVVDDVTDKPVAGAELEVGYGKPITVTSDARGEFVVRGLAFSTLNRPVLRIFARHPDYDLFTDFDTPALGRDQDSPVEVRMGRSERISGEILDAEGAPVAGARVHVEVIGLSPDALGYNPAREVRGESGDDGSFTMPAPSHLRSMIGDIRFVVVARHTRRGAGRSEPLGLPESGKPWPEVRIVLSRGAELSGKVTDSAGKPIAGAAVRVRPSWQAAAGGDSTAGERRSFSKRDGTYTLAGIEAGPFVATAAALGYAAEWVEGRADGEGRIEQHFVLERGAVIAGRVVDAAGLPVAGAEVVAFPAGSFEGEGFADSSEFSLRMHRLHGLGAGAAPSRADGSFRIDGLADGRYLVVARREGYEAAEARGVQAGGVAPDLVLARFSALRGRVLAADTRAPVRAFSVDLVNRKKLAERREEGSFHDYRIASEGEVYFEDYEGRFTYDGLRPGDYELLVKAEGCVHSRLDVAVRAGEVNEVEAALERGARIEGVVVDEETRLAVAGAQVSAQRHREGLPEILDWTSTLSGDDGAFVLAGLREGKYTVGVVHPYYAFASVPSKVEVAAAESSTVPRLEVKLRPAGRVEGRIRGLLSSGAKRTVTQRFDLRRQDATAEPDFFQRVYADPQGRFRAESVPVGTYTVVLIEQEMERGKMTHLGPMGGYQTMKPLGAEKETVLGEVEVAARRTARFNAAVPGR
jgi:protocatechuate 3,4-dioxygenase beta subunit